MKPARSRSGALAKAALAAGVLALASSACDPPPLGHVGKTFLAQAADTRKLGDQPSATVELSQLDPKALPDAAEIRLAVPREVSWHELRTTIESVEKTGKKVVLLTAQTRRIGAFPLYEKVSDRPIDVVVRTDGTACVRLPGVREAKCVQRIDAKHIDRAHLRQLVREAIHVSHIREAAVYVPPDMQWGDVVRSLDGARTCCKKIDRPKVTLVDLETRKTDTDTVLVDAPDE